MDDLLLNNSGELFINRNMVRIPVIVDGLSERIRPIAKKLQGDPYASFFKTPFHKVAYGCRGNILGECAMTPGDFNPGSPFDAFYAVREYIRNGRICFPRMYLYPTSRCNSACPLCQFRKRHEESTSLSYDGIKQALKIFRRHSGEVKRQTLIISGDGEPTMFPYLQELLEISNDLKLEVFLTTNLRCGYAGNRRLYELIAGTCSMVTVSIKGLSADSYAKHQGIQDSEEFGRVIDNLSFLTGARKELGREDKLLLGVASLFLPENTPHYLTMADRLRSLGIDYFYINQVEPSVEHWGITFTKEETAETLRQLQTYASAPHKNMIVRFHENPFVQRYGGTVYYDAAKERIHPEYCGSALFNPLVLSIDGKAVWKSCRNSEVFDDSSFEFQVCDDEIPLKAVGSIMEAASGCRSCRLERQVKHFDKIIDLEMSHHEDLDYYLVFNTERLLASDSSLIKFESVVK